MFGTQGPEVRILLLRPVMSGSPDPPAQRPCRFANAVPGRPAARSPPVPPSPCSDDRHPVRPQMPQLGARPAGPPARRRAPANHLACGRVCWPHVPDLAIASPGHDAGRGDQEAALPGIREPGRTGVTGTAAWERASNADSAEFQKKYRLLIHYFIII